MERKITTRNGIDVYSYPQPHLHSFCIGLYVKAGLLYESPEEAGITHFLEHVLFRNLGGLPQRALYERLESVGAEFNACTYKEFVYFYITAAHRHFEECAGIIAMLLAPLTATVADVSAERRRVQSEIREEDELNSIEHFAKQQVWKGTSLSRLITGTITGVEAIGAERLREEKRRVFAAENMFFYVTGCYAKKDVETLCRLADGYPLEAGRAARENLAPVPEGFMQRGGGVLLRNTADLPGVLFSFDMACRKYSMAELNLLYDILFSGTLSRFSLRLSEDSGLVYDYDAFLEQYGNIGTLHVEFSAMQSRLYEAVGLAAEVFRSMREKIAGEELAHFLPEYTYNHLAALDRPQRLNWDMAYNNHILGKGYGSIEELPGLYSRVTPERLMEISGEIFRPENLVVAVKAERRKIKADTLEGILSSL
jgi:predicted Zn-dependent peptidase